MTDQMDIDSDAPRGVKRTAAEAGLPPEASRRIKACCYPLYRQIIMLTIVKALDQDVVNKIAAGEIIVAPMHALKELLENSIDAGSTAIDVVVKDGGLKLLQITDNGHGIERDDLPILCERFTTSKLKNFEDLMSIGTYGFRGEALASISHIAHLKVTTRTANSSCAWQAHYADGKLTPAKPGQSPDPKPCAGRPGTQITVEDLFYNIPNRRKAFRSPSEEYTKVLDVITRYAVHREGVAFSVKKHGDTASGFSVAAAATKADRIRQAYGGAGKELMEFGVEDTRWGFKASGYATNANYSGKRTIMLLFINNRSVESSTVKKAIEQTYQLFLPKGGHPFVYLCLDIDPGRVDVNVHPTKREVHFLNEDEIIELVCNNIRESLAKVDTSRTFQTQTLLPGVTPMTPMHLRAAAADKTPPTDDSATRRTSTTKKPYENNLVRTDSRMRKITSMLPPALSATTSQDESAAPEAARYTTTDREQVQIRLTSIKNLRAEVREAMHNGLTEVFASLTYVGVVDSNRRLAAMQSGVKLYLVDYGMTANEFFYQIGLTDFGNFGLIQLQPPPSLREILEIAAQHQIETDSECADLDKQQVVQKVHDQLMSRRQMLSEYFSIEISEEGLLEAIPLLLKGYMPCMAKLPTFLLRLGPFVDWTHEELCFRTLLRELASFYVPEQLPRAAADRESQPATARARMKGTETVSQDSHDTNDELEAGTERRRKELESVLEHVLFPAFRSRIVATKGMLKGVIEVANLKGLYRVFERC
ncbi:DNA mismatch repair protein Mlh1 [Elasticomyces elasticus]|uniref:DNA mismatch repair protein Mlh1 n=1 Tax=Exophiala sideris TaxID=1016849 RepID=A0ABR0IZS4_9EURO|nr:DNA mismatch repair protein Mlh1 [Elasticomyces elasticus]KAK5023187.1 DNA mismatch repair protein Mlh1 [Exophiala sideris]KAK5028559.1 DNA mismatch repair protein Mlh1 [Exophiala sideris]KAK5052937.1 DNA mismatch repair protein Mlh1 [Exophiala sideris]KAK5178677.1 DNA mismatch repair protein Mlh1 [Eurotiomycetes sp. CCFEE 6388]